MSGIKKSERHGMHGTPEHRAWANMLHRCRNPKHINFKNWGGRGIAVCQEWADFKRFFADMGQRPSGMTLERVDNSKGYGPDNCVWASHAEQHRNTRQTRLITIDGKTRCLKDWCREYGISYSTGKHRVLVLGLQPIDALTTPVDTNWRIANLKGNHRDDARKS